MDLISWYKKRGFKFIWQRGKSLVSRYGLSSSKAASRIEASVQALAEVDCWMTFPVPGMVVKSHPDFIRRIQELGSEIAVHGYNHIDLKSCPPDQSCKQLLRAVELFQKEHLVVSGFRCPYLSYTDELIKIIPPGVFKYSSNTAICWNIAIPTDNPCSLLVNTIDQFYIPQNAESSVCVPWTVNGMVEIPVCVPDDLQLIDGYQMTPKMVTDTWVQVLKEIHHRGELYNLMFHPELAAFNTNLFLNVIAAARQLKPAVWICRLDEIADWWIEKSRFSYDISLAEGKYIVNINCSPRATILCRGFQIDELDQIGSYVPWDDRYVSVESRCFSVSTKVKPIIGICSTIPIEVKDFLIEQGYLIDSSAQAHECSIFLDDNKLKNYSSHVDLVRYIENSDGPLVRIWRWPNGAKSAMSITGDLDALSLVDYFSRMFIK
jgi:hypothetical protein